MANRMVPGSLRNGRIAAVGLSLLGTAVVISGVRAQGRKAAPPAAPAAQAQKAQFGDTVVTAEQIDYDTQNRQFIFSTRVDLVSKNTHMTARKMTVQLNAENAMQWVKCEGNVSIDKKDPEDGSTMTARGQTLDYH